MSIKTLSRVWDLSPQRGAMLLLLLAISDYADDNGFAWPGIETLAHKIRMSTSQTRRMTKRLAEIGELAIFDREARTNCYIVKAGLSQEMYDSACGKAREFHAILRAAAPPVMDAPPVTAMQGGGVIAVQGGGVIAVTPDPSLPVIHPLCDGDDVHHDHRSIDSDEAGNNEAIAALIASGWNAGEADAAAFVATHGAAHIVAVCKHAKAHKFGAGWIRKNAGTWKPSKGNGNGRAEAIDGDEARRQEMRKSNSAYVCGKCWTRPCACAVGVTA